MTAHLKLTSEEVAPLRDHYQGIAHDVLKVILRYKFLISSFLLVGIAIATSAIITLPPYYTSEAILQVNFRNETTNPAIRIDRVASMEAGAVVEGTARILRSRTIAGAVVSRLGLADDPSFARPSTSMRVSSSIRQMLGLPTVVPSAQDIATERFSRAVQITVVPRSYLIVVAISAGDPERSALLANSVVLEYLRGQRIQLLVDAQLSLARDIVEISGIFGANHPRKLDAQQRMNELQSRIAELQVAEASQFVPDESTEFFPARAVMIPSGPNGLIIFGLVLGLALLLCAGVIFLLEFVALGSIRLAIPGRV